MVARMPKESLQRTAFLISGGGTTMDAAISAWERKEIPGVRPVAVIASRPDAPGLKKAIGHDIPALVVNPNDFQSRDVFGGKGMYGKRVTCARIIYEWMIQEKMPWTESAVHYVTSEYDKGDLIRIERMNFYPFEYKHTDHDLFRSESLRKGLVAKTVRVSQWLLHIEHKNVIEALKAFGQGERSMVERSQRVVKPGEESLLQSSKTVARQLFPHG